MTITVSPAVPNAAVAPAQQAGRQDAEPSSLGVFAELVQAQVESMSGEAGHIVSEADKKDPKDAEPDADVTDLAALLGLPASLTAAPVEPRALPQQASDKGEPRLAGSQETKGNGETLLDAVKGQLADQASRDTGKVNGLERKGSESNALAAGEAETAEAKAGDTGEAGPDGKPLVPLAQSTVQSRGEGLVSTLAASAKDDGKADRHNLPELGVKSALESLNPLMASADKTDKSHAVASERTPLPLPRIAVAGKFLGLPSVPVLSRRHLGIRQLDTLPGQHLRQPVHALLQSVPRLRRSGHERHTHLVVSRQLEADFNRPQMRRIQLHLGTVQPVPQHQTDVLAYFLAPPWPANLCLYRQVQRRTFRGRDMGFVRFVSRCHQRIQRLKGGLHTGIRQVVPVSLAVLLGRGGKS